MKVSLTDSYKSPEIFEKNFKQFIENNKRLTHLKIYLNFNNQNQKDSVFRHITKLDQLVSLRIGRYDHINQIINCLRQLSHNCLNMKALNVNNRINSLDKFKSFMTEVKKFKALERIKFRIVLEKNTELHQLKEYFEGLESLTHLTIKFPNYDIIENDFLKDIDKSLPKLRVLRLYTKIKVSENRLDNLGRLARLGSLEIVVNNESILYLITDKIENNWRKNKMILYRS